MPPALPAFTEFRKRRELPMPPAPMGPKISYWPILPLKREAYEVPWSVAGIAALEARKERLGMALQETASELCASGPSRPPQLDGF
jgi:hypothetical protein